MLLINQYEGKKNWSEKSKWANRAIGEEEVAPVVVDRCEHAGEKRQQHHNDEHHHHHPRVCPVALSEAGLVFCLGPFWTKNLSLSLAFGDWTAR